MTYIVRYLITYGVYGVYGYDNCVAPECVHGQKRARCGCAYFIFVGPQRVRMHLMVLPGFCGIEWHTTSVSPLSTSTETFVSCSLLFSVLRTTNIRSTPVSPLHNTDCSIHAAVCTSGTRCHTFIFKSGAWHRRMYISNSHNHWHILINNVVFIIETNIIFIKFWFFFFCLFLINLFSYCVVVSKVAAGLFVCFWCVECWKWRHRAYTQQIHCCHNVPCLIHLGLKPNPNRNETMLVTHRNTVPLHYVISW